MGIIEFIFLVLAISPVVPPVGDVIEEKYRVICEETIFYGEYHPEIPACIVDAPTIS